MGLLSRDIFCCLDCETTGLDPQEDRIIECAVVTFSFSQILHSYETLIDPERKIPEESIQIHSIQDCMVEGKPKIQEVLPSILQVIDRKVIVGHGIGLDLAFLEASAKRNQMAFISSHHPTIDTLRLARLYGESPVNSLEKLRQHFNIPAEQAHRAMGDVIVNISVFKHLAANFKTTEQILERLKKPILLKTMPLGKYKGRAFDEIPVEYLSWAARADFDIDLLFSVRSELNKRKQKGGFNLANNPFSHL